MHMRIVRGRVLDGHEPDFVALSRRLVPSEAWATRPVSFMAGYRRVEGSDRFLLVSTWEGEPPATETLAGAFDVERVDDCKQMGPSIAGIVDSPGAVIRLTEARLRSGKREALIQWLKAKEREMRGQRWMIACALGERTDSVGTDWLMSASGWASPLLIEQFGESDRPAAAALFADFDEFVTDFHVERYQAVELALSTLAEAGARRVIAARFGSEREARSARSSLTRAVPSASRRGISVAHLSAAHDDRGEPCILVARVSFTDYPFAERMIADLGGQVVLAHDELGEDDPSLEGRESLGGPGSLATT